MNMSASAWAQTPTRSIALAETQTLESPDAVEMIFFGETGDTTQPDYSVILDNVTLSQP